MREYTLPNFLGGVSKQPETQRRLGTVHECINAFPNISEGLQKRSGLYYERTLAGIDGTDAFKVHFITTSSATFVMFISDDATNPIQIFDLTTGAAKTINYADNSMKDYIRYIDADSGNAIIDRDSLLLLSVFDSTFLVNKTVVCSLTGTADGTTVTNGVTYGNSGDGSYGITTDTRVYPSYSDFPAIVGKSDPSNPNQNYVNTTGWADGEYFRALNAAIGFPAGVYLSKDLNGAIATSVGDVDLYTQQITDYDNSLIDRTTMPLRVVYNELTDDFDVTWSEWTARYSGTPETSPGPSFIGRTIDDMVFHKNRLWIAADEFIVASRAGDYFTFWPIDPLDIVPSDMIDETIADTGLNKILYTVPFRQALILFTEGNRQFEVRSTGPMAPDSISIVPTTNYGTSATLRPTFLGNNLYFMSAYLNYGQVFEYFYIDNAANNVATNVTRHIPDYLPTDLNTISPDVNNGLIFLSQSGTNDMYVYCVQWEGDQRLQNAFVKFEFPNFGGTILTHKVVDSVLYLVAASGSDINIYSLDVVNRPMIGDIPYNESLDYSEQFSSGTYDSGTNMTHWDLHFDATGLDLEAIVMDTISPDDNWVGFSLNITTSMVGGVTRVSVRGDYSTRHVVIGVPVAMQVALNLIYPYDREGNPESGTYTYKTFILYLTNTVQLTVRIDTTGRPDDFSFDYSVVKLDGSDIQWNAIPTLESTRMQSIIYGTGAGSRIYIEDTSPFPITLVSGEIRGVFSKTLNTK